jgi:hypothetical protein
MSGSRRTPLDPGERDRSESEGQTIDDRDAQTAQTDWESWERDSSDSGTDAPPGGGGSGVTDGLQVGEPPNVLGPGYFGEITWRTRNGTLLRYQVTPIDVAYFAQSLARENRLEVHNTGWCMVQRFIGYKGQNIPSLKRLVETFSQPVNPGWAWPTGSPPSPPPGGFGSVQTGCPDPPFAEALRKAALPENAAAVTPERLARRQGFILQLRAIHAGGPEGVRQWRSIPLRARVAAYAILRGEAAPPPHIVGWDDFASYPGIRNSAVDLYRLTGPVYQEALEIAKRRGSATGRGQSQEAISQEILAVAARTLVTGRGNEGIRAVRFVEGGECYNYHTTNSSQEFFESIVIVGPGRANQSNRSRVRDFLDVSDSGRWGGSGDGGSGTRAQGTIIGSSTSGSIQVGYEGVSNTYDIDIYDIPPRAVLWNRLREWGRETCIELSSTHPLGIRIR